MNYPNSCEQMPERNMYAAAKGDANMKISAGSQFSVGIGGANKPRRSARKSSSSQALEEAYSHEEFERKQHAIMRAGYHQFFETLGPSLIPLLAQMQGQISEFMRIQGFWESANTGEKVALMHSELSELLEADRNGVEHDDKIPEFTGIEAELADLFIRGLDFAGHHKLRLAEAIVAKMHVNIERPFKHGKAY